MAELSVEESQRLARLFLTGLASEADVQRLAGSLPDDPTVALELLAQVQTALDDVAPEGLDKEQAQSVTARVAALVQPRVKRRGLFSLFKRLFRRRPPAAAPAPAGDSRADSRGTLGAELDAPMAPVPAGVGGPPAMDEGAGLEEMAPIAPAPEAAPFAAPLEPARAPVAVPPPPARHASGVALTLTVLAVLAALVGAYLLRHRRPAAAAAHPAAAKPSLAPVPTPKPAGPALRERAIAVTGSAANEALPAALPPTTPLPAGF
jgi:hypothetical protein